MATQHVNSITQWCTLGEVGESEEESEERESLDKHLASGKLRPAPAWKYQIWQVLSHEYL